MTPSSKLKEGSALAADGPVKRTSRISDDVGQSITTTQRMTFVAFCVGYAISPSERFEMSLLL